LDVSFSHDLANTNRVNSLIQQKPTTVCWGSELGYAVALM